MVRAKTDPTRNDDAASKAEPSPWLSFEDAFEQWCRLGSSELARGNLRAFLRSGVPTLELLVHFGGAETRSVKYSDFWKNTADVWVETDVDAKDHLRVNCPSSYYPASVEYVSYFLPTVDFEHETARLYPTTAPPPPAPSKEPALSEVLPRQKPGPKPDLKYWEKMEAKCYGLMDHHGNFDASDPEWDCQARLEEALMGFSENTLGRELGESTLREKLPGWLSTWHERKTGGA